LKKIFLICPVRNISKHTENRLREYVNKLESQGHMVYWPFRDTDQNDRTGLRIMRDNRQAIWEAPEVHIWLDANSEGSRTDLGMYFAFLMFTKKKLVVANRGDIFSTPDKSFNNFILSLAGENLDPESEKASK